MTQPVLSAEAELHALLVRYDYGAMPPGIAARVADLKRTVAPEHNVESSCSSAMIAIEIPSDRDDR